MKKIVSLLISLLMIFTCLPIPVIWADDDNSDSNTDLSYLTITTKIKYSNVTQFPYPEFSPEITNYDLFEPENITSLKITAAPATTKAALEINGAAAASGAAITVSLPAEKYMTVDIKVTAGDGSSKTYTIKINDAPFNGQGPGIPQTPSEYNSSEYVRVGGKIIGNMDFFALDTDGSVIGYDSDAQTSSYTNCPEKLENVKAIGATKSGYNGIALKQDGTVTVWGDKDMEAYNVPDNMTSVTAISAGNNHFLALKKDKTIAAWGDNTYGQCDVPAGLNGVAAIAAGTNHCLALKEDGTVVAWGDNSMGQCNVSPDLEGVACIYAYANVSVALKEDGMIAVWGDNSKNQCNVPPGLQDVLYVSIGESGTCAALKKNGTIAVWGYNPYSISGLHDVTSIAVQNSTIYAARKDGTAIAWNNKGVLRKYISLSKVVSILPNDFVICRGGTVTYTGDAGGTGSEVAKIQEAADGVNVLSGHCFDISNVQLLDSENNGIASVAAGGTYQIKANINNYYCEDAEGNVLIQVRGDDGADAAGGGRVLSCIRQKKTIPLEGTTVSTDFTMPEHITGTVYIDVFVWDKGSKPVPKAAPDQSLKVTVN